MFKVVCIEAFTGAYTNSTNRIEDRMPLVDKIYTVCGMSGTGKGYYLLELNYTNSIGYRASFVKYKFRKVDETFATETLAEIAEQIESEQLIIK